MKTATAHANGIDIAYDTFGKETDDAVVLIMGLGTQRIAWADEFCEELASAGRYVVRFDNRDVGESTHLTDRGQPTLIDLLLGRSPYRLEDMADDVTGLLDALSVNAAHIVGVSLGGFIAQTVALRNPARVQSLTLIMTSTGSRSVGRAKPRALLQLLVRRGASSKDEAIEQALAVYKVIGSPGYPLDEARFRQRVGIAYDRAYDPGGYRRQMAASLRQPDRTDDLRGLAIPTLVIHGLADPLISPTGGLALAEAIPFAKFIGFAGMGHDLPLLLWPQVTKELIDHTSKADQQRPLLPGASP